MSLEAKSKELKQIVGSFDTRWLLGNLSFLMHAGKGKAPDQLGNLSSPLRQLYYLAGLNVSSDPNNAQKIQYTEEEWDRMVELLNGIEAEYHKLFLAENPDEITEDWKRVRQVAMPSFLSYFNQGPLNYEEQVINWVKDLYSPLDNEVLAETGLSTGDFIQFYENLDQLVQKNFQGHSGKKELLRPNWEEYSELKTGVADDAPDFIKEMGENDKHLYTFMADNGIKDRFRPEELASAGLSIEKVKTILRLLSTTHTEREFLYYTETRPGNPLYEKPILDLGENMFQVFEVKQVIHAIENLLEQTCSKTQASKDKYIENKGKLLEDRIIDLFSKLFKTDFKVFRGYYVDGCEQDILILWKKYAFIIEGKGYAIREPFRNPDKAFVRIKDDFNASLGYGYAQTRRVEKKFIDQVPLRITDNTGKLIEEIDTTLYDQDFSIIVNLNSFGQIQCDLAALLKLEDEEDVYPWAVKLDDLEIFLLTLIAQKKTPQEFVDFLLMRELLHGKLICSDELEVCGGFLGKKLLKRRVEKMGVVATAPDLGNVFDAQYYKGMGLKNEKYLEEKKSGKYLFW